MFVAATSKTSSYSLCMWYWPMLSLSFLDVYWAADLNKQTLLDNQLVDYTMAVQS
jgi:hypothetical protein